MTMSGRTFQISSWTMRMSSGIWMIGIPSQATSYESLFCQPDRVNRSATTLNPSGV